MGLGFELRNLKIENIVGVASGTFGYGSEYEKLMDLNSVGMIFTKAVTLEPRPGNDIPRIIESPSGLINSIGLANVGLKAFIKEKLPYLVNMPSEVIVNVAGSTPEEYKTIVKELEKQKGIAAYEINLSCPNVKQGCLAFGTDPENVKNLTNDLRKLTDRPLIIKLTPNVTDISSIALAAEAGGADSISCINTLVGMAIDIKTKKPVLKAFTGGLSGPAIKPVGLACTFKVASAVKIPVIGIGGIMCPEDAIEYLLAGASAIQIGTGTFVDPALPEKVLTGINDYAKHEGFKSIEDFHGHF